MTAKDRSTIVGVFEDRRHADQAVADLKKAGFRDDQIGIAMRHTDASDDIHTTGDDAESHVGSSAMTGALTGMGLGALAGLGVLAGVIPVVGPAIAGGTLGVIFSNAAAGAGIAGLIGALAGAGLSDEEATYYHGEFEAGRTIVTVTADGRCDDACGILRNHGAYDMSSRASAASGAASGSTTHGTAHATSTSPRAMTGRESDTIQVKDERLHAEKQPVETGEVRVRKEVHVENKHIDVPVQREEVVIERTPMHGRAAAEGITADDIREGEEIRIPVREEQVNVGKETVVTEEVKVGKRTVQDTEHVSGQVRKEDVHIEREGNVDVQTHGTDHGRK